LASLRCNDCVHLKKSFCSKIGEALANPLAKLFYGGAESLYSGSLMYPSECGIEKEHTPETALKVFLAVEYVQELP
jgi:hypothetical protein